MGQSMPHARMYYIYVFFYSWVAQAADAESSESKWSKEDIVELVGMLLAVPAGLVALAMLASYVKRIRERSNANDAERNQHEMSANIPDQIDDTQDTTASRPDGFASGPNGASQAGLLYPHRAARSWPSFRPGYLRGDNGMTAETSMRLSGTVPVSRTELRIVSVNATWHEEIDAHVEKERLDWAEERPYPAGCVRD